MNDNNSIQHIPDISTITRLLTHVQQAVEDYNNRPHHVLNGLTPLEILNGKIPGGSSYTDQINKARATRLTENKKMKCCYSF